MHSGIEQASLSTETAAPYKSVKQTTARVPKITSVATGRHSNISPLVECAVVCNVLLTDDAE